MTKDLIDAGSIHVDSYPIRLIKLSDLDGYFNLIDNNRKRLESFFAGLVAITKDLEATKVHLQDVIAKCEDRKFYSFVIIEHSSQKIIGSVQLKSFDWNIPKAEVGYFIDKNFEGKGITTAAVSRIIDFGFNSLHLNKLFLRANEDNKGSVMVAEKNGFEKEGVLRKDYRSADGTLVDLTYYGLLRPGQSK